MNTGKKVRIGWLEGATYPDGTPVAAAMFWFEFGHGGRFPSPPRPVFRNMIAKESPKWPAKMAALVKATKYDGGKVLALMGDDIAGALKEGLINFTVPALSPTTLILRKWFGNDRESITLSDVLRAHQTARNGEQGASGTQAKPGVWTGHALDSISFEVTT